MNAHALLTSQGWRGTGHSLHSSSDKIGLSRPLLVSQKQNTLGVGKKQHRTSDMWWMNAFDKTLQGLDTSAEGKVVQTVTNGGLDMVAKGGSKYVGTGGLYASFVRGECLFGTMNDDEENKDIIMETEDPVQLDYGRKRKRKDAVEETKEERKARKAAKRAARAQTPTETSPSHTSSPKIGAKEIQNRKATKTGVSASDSQTAAASLPTPPVEEETPIGAETKEQRKGRRKLEKLVAKELAFLNGAMPNKTADGARKKKRRIEKGD